MRNEDLYMYKLQRIPVTLLANPPDEAHAIKGVAAFSETLANMSNSLVYVWLKEGKNFWIYITYSCDTYVEGYVWAGEKWTFAMIPIEAVKAYY